MDGDFSLAWESISTLLYVGVTVGIVLAVLALSLIHISEPTRRRGIGVGGVGV